MKTLKSTVEIVLIHTLFSFPLCLSADSNLLPHFQMDITFFANQYIHVTFAFLFCSWNKL